MSITLNRTNPAIRFAGPNAPELKKATEDLNKAAKAVFEQEYVDTEDGQAIQAALICLKTIEKNYIKAKFEPYKLSDSCMPAVKTLFDVAKPIFEDKYFEVGVYGTDKKTDWIKVENSRYGKKRPLKIDLNSEYTIYLFNNGTCLDTANAKGHLIIKTLPEIEEALKDLAKRAVNPEHTLFS